MFRFNLYPYNYVKRMRWGLLIFFVILIITQILPSDINHTKNKRSPPKSDLIWMGEITQSCGFTSRNNYWLIPSCGRYPAGGLVRVISKHSDISANDRNIQKRLTAAQVLPIAHSDDSWLFWYSVFSRHMVGWRGQVITNFWVWLGRNEGSLLFSFVFGGTQLLEENIRQAIKQVGLSHMVAASGLQVGILAYLVSGLPGLARRWPKVLIQIGVVWLYAWVGLFAASVLRAVAMITLSRLAFLWQRKPASIWILIWSGLILCLIWPILVFSPGFQLSFVATLGLLLQAKSPLSQLAVGTIPEVRPAQISTSWLKRLQNYCRDASQMSLVAQIWTTPLVLYYFGQLSVWSVVSTTLVSWLALPLFNWGLFLAVATSFSSGIAVLRPILTALVWPSRLLAGFFIWIALFLNQINPLVWEINEFPAGAVGLWYLGLILIHGLRRRRYTKLRPIDLIRHSCADA